MYASARNGKVREATIAATVNAWKRRPAGPYRGSLGKEK